MSTIIPPHLYLWIFCEDCILYIFSLVVLLLAAYYFSKLPRKPHPLRLYGYSYHNGPHEWPRHFPASAGCKQSPINVDSARAVRLDSRASCRPLLWRNRECLPNAYTMLNDGRKVALIGTWAAPNMVPEVTGGPLGSAVYRLVGMHFRWGANDEWGGEHTLDNRSFPLELQMLLIRQDFATPKDALASKEGNSMTMVSYFFKIAARDNPYLDAVVLNLGRIRRPGAKHCLPPFPLDWLAPPFSSRFFAYVGSLSEPPCAEVVIWILRFTPQLHISSRQLHQFRILLSADGPITRNSRPVQLLWGRKVFLYK
ncbi:carbonic anhydrase 2-like [Ischnura elegans]|uniref:carbonic anhydrase 2-like n=1 Tax=Ischnura elegans TaxID=197161 RepID=UPI001ED8A856|nr:carbonic anhydrase 2-like [Ischnura elegans]